MRLTSTSLLCTMLLAEGALAQTLQHRQHPADVPLASANRATEARQALPVAAEGEYRWRQPGEIIELYVEDGALRGYLTRRSERDHAESAPMTFALAEARTDGRALSFSTRHIHGEWYSFQGQVARGPAASRHVDGYYLLQGTLSIHTVPSQPGDTTAGDGPVTSQVSLKQAASRRPAE